MNAVWVALIVAVASMAGPLLLARSNAKIREREKTADQEQKAKEKAERDEVAAQLLVASKKVAETADLTNGKLDEIHTLVNSNMTAAMQAELDATKRELAMMREVISLKRAAGHEPAQAALTAIEATQVKIGELEATLADRLNASSGGE